MKGLCLCLLFFLVAVPALACNPSDFSQSASLSHLEEILVWVDDQIEQKYPGISLRDLFGEYQKTRVTLSSCQQHLNIILLDLRSIPKQERRFQSIFQEENLK